MNATTLYRHFDEDGILLYVGITDRGGRRIAEHRSAKVWWRFVALTTHVHIEDRSLAQQCEKTVIENENPVFNIVHGSDSRDAAVFDYLHRKSSLRPSAPVPATVHDLTGHGEPSTHTEQFIAECLVIGGGDSSRVPSAVIFTRYLEWCQLKGVEPVSQNAQARELTALGCGKWRNSFSHQRTNVSLRTHAFRTA